MHFDWERLTDSVHRCRLPFLDVTVGLVQGRTATLLIDTGTTLAEAAAIDADVRQLAGQGEKVCRLPFLDVTVGLVQGRTGAMLIDTGTTLAEAAAIDADVRQLAGRRVTHVVLTHKHFDHVLGSSVFVDAETYCAPDVVEYLSSRTDQLRDDALRYGADVEEIDRAIAALRPPQHGIDNAIVDLGNSPGDDRLPGPWPHHLGPGRGGAGR